MTATMECKDYTAFSEKELLKMLGANERQENKLKAQLDNIAQERHFIKDAIMQKWRKPSDELLSKKPKKATKAVKKAKEPEFVKFDEAPIIKKIDDYQKSLPEKQQKAILQEIQRLAYGSATIK